MKKTVKRWKFKAGTKISTTVLGSAFAGSLILTALIISMLVANISPETAVKMSENSITGFMYAGAIIGMPAIIVCVIVMRQLKKIYIVDYKIETDEKELVVMYENKRIKLPREGMKTKYREKRKGGRAQIGELFIQSEGKTYSIIGRCDIFGKSKEIDLATMRRIAETIG